ncbi:MAG: hypothetical protein KH328_06305 [Staphylococcus sp.]|nr:hypothetical protein [Staphylococcus sp.]
MARFSINEVKRINSSEYENSEFAIGKMGFLSTRPNSHQLNISETVLKESAPSVLGKWIVADMTGVVDAGTHTEQEYIVGMVPRDQEVDFVYDEDGYLKSYVDVIISKVYAKNYCAMFESDNLRNVSVEMNVHTSEEDEHEVLDFNIVGVTTLGKHINPSCPGSDIVFTRFSETEANAFFEDCKKKCSNLENFMDQRKNKMSEEKKYKIDKSKEALSDKPWGEVDKTKLRNDIMGASNKNTLVKDVYMLVEDGWEDAPSEHLKYPVMELKGDTFVYNRDGLASALGYAKKEDETAVVNKIEKIYKKLDLDDNEGGKEEKMAEIEFSAVNIGDLWGRLWHEIDETRHWEYSIDGVFEEDNKKFAVLRDGSGKLYRLDFSLTEDGMTVADEVIEVKQDFIDTDNIRKFSEPENVEQYQKFAEVEPEKKEMSIDEAMAEIDRLSKDVEDNKNIIMDKDKQMKDMEKELSELRAFKEAADKQTLAASVESVMSEVKDCLSDDKYKEFRDEGLQCSVDGVDAWANKVKAFCFETGVKKKAQKGTMWSFANPAQVESKINSIW